jgi:hypothetical protein
MKKKFTKNGFDVIEDTEKNTHYITDFPQFPNKNIRSKDIFQTIEQIVLTEKHISFPMKFNIIERVVKLCIDTQDYFSFEGIKNLINRDKHLFIGTDTFFKVKFSYEENFPILKIIYYIIDNEKGQIDCFSMNMLLNIIFINYNQQQFTKRRVNYLQNVVGLNMDEIRQIPILPVQWLNFDKDGNLLDFPNFQTSNEE